MLKIIGSCCYYEHYDVLYDVKEDKYFVYQDGFFTDVVEVANDRIYYDYKITLEDGKTMCFDKTYYAEPFYKYLKETVEDMMNHYTFNNPSTDKCALCKEIIKQLVDDEVDLVDLNTIEDTVREFLHETRV